MSSIFYSAATTASSQKTEAKFKCKPLFHSLSRLWPLLYGGMPSGGNLPSRTQRDFHKAGHSVPPRPNPSLRGRGLTRDGHSPVHNAATVRYSHCSLTPAKDPQRRFVFVRLLEFKCQGCPLYCLPLAILPRQLFKKAQLALQY